MSVHPVPAEVFLSVAAALGGAGAWFISRYAYRFGLLDIPNDRSSHNLPTPRGGGIGILAAYAVTSVWLRLPLLIWLPAAALAVVSFFDDKLDLSPRTRLFFQFGAALIVAGFTWRFFEVFSSQHPTAVLQNLLLLLFCSIVIAGTANFYNFMDGINGIAGITGVVAFCLLGCFATFNTQHVAIAYSSFAIAVACAGFLPFNVPKARVFMGDVGSILLGFVFAVYVVTLTRTATDLLVLAGFLSTFYADALTTLYVRKRDGERLSQAHRRHLYQLFANQKQVAHWKVSTCYGLLQAGVGVTLLVLYPLGWRVVAVWEVLLLAGWWLLMQRVRRASEG